MLADSIGSAPTRLVLMGVAGCGKSTIGQALAQQTGIAYRDGDDLHPAANIAKMSRGEPLTDADRWPWLTEIGATFRHYPQALMIGCSALKRRYRDLIRSEAGGPVCFVHLAGSRAVIAARMATRTGHFMPTTLLDSQFAALEPPEPDEWALTVELDQPQADMVAAIIAALALPARTSPPGQ